MVSLFTPLLSQDGQGLPSLFAISKHEAKSEQG